jgi:hypothetical protein
MHNVLLPNLFEHCCCKKEWNSKKFSELKRWFLKLFFTKRIDCYHIIFFTFLEFDDSSISLETGDIFVFNFFLKLWKNLEYSHLKDLLFLWRCRWRIFRSRIDPGRIRNQGKRLKRNAFWKVSFSFSYYFVHFSTFFLQLERFFVQ